MNKGIIFCYDLMGRIVSKREYVKDNDIGYRLTTYEYDNEGRLVTENEYLEYQSISSESGKVRVIKSDYDADGRLIRLWDSTGACAEYEYDECDRKTVEKQKINENKAMIKKYEYDCTGKLISTITSADKKLNSSGVAVIRYEYDENGNMTRMITPLGNEIRRTYDDDNRMITEEHFEPGGQINNMTRFDYDAADNITSKVFMNGAAHVYKYDSLNRIIMDMDENRALTLIMYDGSDNISRIIKQNELDKKARASKGYTYIYNKTGKLEKVVAPDGVNILNRTYNIHDEMISQRDASDRGIDIIYDIGGRKASIRTSGKAEQTYEYDPQGNVVRLYSSDRITSYELDEWGRIINTVNPEGETERMSYDYAGNITSRVNASGRAVNYTYNEINKLETVTFRDNAVERYTYDAEGRLSVKIDRKGRTTRYAYNMYGSLTRTAGDVESDIKDYSYMPDGKLKSAFAGGMRYDYEYDLVGRITAKKASGRSLLEYAYDSQGNKTMMKDVTCKAVYYEYDLMDRMTAVYDQNTQLASYVYYPDGSLKQIKSGKDIVTEYSYDADGNLSSLYSAAGDMKITDNTYLYDAYGNCTEKRMISGTSLFTYDRNDRLTSAVYPSGQEQFSYDVNGNRSRHIVHKNKLSYEELYTYDEADRLISRSIHRNIEDRADRNINSDYVNGTVQKQADINTVNYSYDANGNMISDGNFTYEYNSFDQMTKATSSNGSTQICRYDAEDLRYEVEENERLVRFIFNDVKVVHEESTYDSIRYIRGNILLSSDSEKARTYYHYVSDERGSITCILGADDNVKNYYEYDAFGNILNGEETIPNRFRYDGEQFDCVTNQYYLRARYYNPIIARFTQEDTYHGDGMNLYAYACDIIGLNQKKPFKQKEFWLV